MDRVAERADRRVDVAHQDGDLLRQLTVLADEPARGVARVLRLPADFRRNEGAREEVLAEVRGQVGAAARTQVAVVAEEVRCELMLPEALAARAALRDGMIPAEREEQRPLLVVQLVRTPAVEMDDVVDVERDRIVGGQLLLAPPAVRLSHAPVLAIVTIAYARRASTRSSTQRRRTYVRRGPVDAHARWRGPNGLGPRSHLRERRRSRRVSECHIAEERAPQRHRDVRAMAREGGRDGAVRGKPRDAPRSLDSASCSDRLVAAGGKGHGD